jgi:hypothetical protein
MKTAKKARGIVYNAIDEKSIKEWKMLEAEIEKAINKHQYSTTIDGRITSGNAKKLKDLGYKIDYGTQYNQSFVSISWQNA